MPESQDRNVLVTGATSDIGMAVCRAYATAGWNVLGQYRTPSSHLAELEREMADCGAECTMLQCDFNEPGAIEKFLAQACEYPVHALINNAGGYDSAKPSDQLTENDVTRTLASNLTAPLLITSKFFPHMCDQGFGRIVNVSSVAAKYGGSDQSIAYGCAKRGLEGITLTFSRSGAEQGVLVNNVRLGVMDTRHYQKFPKDMAQRISLIPMKRMGSPAEAAAAIHFLGSDANTFITGTTLPVSGGE